MTLPTNLLIEPLVPAVMAGGALTSAAGLLPGPLADFCGLLTWLPARALLLVVEGFGGLPWAARPIAAPGWPVVGGLYTLLGAAVGTRSWLPVLRGAAAALPAGTRPAFAALLGGLAGGLLLGAWALLLLG